MSFTSFQVKRNSVDAFDFLARFSSWPNLRLHAALGNFSNLIASTTCMHLVRLNLAYEVAVLLIF